MPRTGNGNLWLHDWWTVKGCGDLRDWPTSPSSDTKSKTGRHPEWLGDLSKVKQWEKTKIRPLVFCCADELKTMNRSLVICEFRSTQKGQFLISRKHQLHVYTPRTSTTGRVASDGKHVQWLSWGGVARNCKWQFPTCEFARGWSLCSCPQFSVFWEGPIPLCWQEILGTPLRNQGARALKCLLRLPCTNPVNLESQVLCPSVSSDASNFLFQQQASLYT